MANCAAAIGGYLQFRRCPHGRLLKNADRVKIACLAQLVNVIAPIMTEKNGDTWKQTIFYPFMQVSNYGRGVVLNPRVESETYQSKDFAEVPYIETIAVHNDETGELVIFAVNRSEDREIAFTFEEEGFGLESILEATELAGYDKKDTNATDHDLVKLQEKSDVILKDDAFSTVLKPLSWNVIRINTK